MPQVDINWTAIGIAVTAGMAAITSVYVLGNSLVEGRVASIQSMIVGTEKQLDARVSRNRALLRDISVQLVDRISLLENTMIHKDRYELAVTEVFNRLDLRVTGREFIEVQARISRLEALLFQEALKGNPITPQSKLGKSDRLVMR